MMLLTFTFRLKVKSPYFLRFIHRKQVLYHQLTLKNSPHVTQLLGQKRNDDFYNRGISVSFFFLTPNKTMTLKGYDIVASFESQNRGNMHKYL